MKKIVAARDNDRRVEVDGINAVELFDCFPAHITKFILLLDMPSFIVAFVINFRTVWIGLKIDI